MYRNFREKLEGYACCSNLSLAKTLLAYSLEASICFAF